MRAAQRLGRYYLSPILPVKPTFRRNRPRRPSFATLRVETVKTIKLLDSAVRAAKNDPLIRVECLALAMGKSMNNARRAWLSGQIPPPDQLLTGLNVGLWRISTIRRHDPALAARCLALVRALESMPKAA